MEFEGSPPISYPAYMGEGFAQGCSFIVGLDRRSFKTEMDRAPSKQRWIVAPSKQRWTNSPSKQGWVEHKAAQSGWANSSVSNLVLLKNPNWMGFLSTRNNKRDYFPIYVLYYTYVLYIHIYYPLTPFILSSIVFNCLVVSCSLKYPVLWQFQQSTTSDTTKGASPLPFFHHHPHPSSLSL